MDLVEVDDVAIDPTAQLGSNVANTTSQLLFWGTVGAITIFVVLIGLGVLLWILNVKRYKYLIEVRDEFDDVLANYKARAIVVRTTEGVHSLMFIKKLKKYIKFPSREFIKNNKIKMYFRPDGELSPIKTTKITVIDRILRRTESKTNQILQDADKNSDVLIPLVSENIREKMALANVIWIDEDMRLSHVSTAKIVKDMFSIYKFFKEHGATLILILAVLIMGVVAVLVFSSMSDFYQEQGNVHQASLTIANRMEELNKQTVELSLRIKEAYEKINVQNAPPN